MRPLLWESPARPAVDTSFAVLHGLYWLAVNLADRRPLLIAVDDAHWADEPSLRWLAYLAPRLEGLALALLVALRPGEPASTEPSLAALRADASAVVRPALLSEGAVGAIVRAAVGGGASDELCAAVWAASGGNPLYVSRAAAGGRARRAAAGRARSGAAAGRRARGDRAAGAWPGCVASIRARWASRRRSPCSGTAASCATRRRSPGGDGGGHASGRRPRSSRGVWRATILRASFTRSFATRSRRRSAATSATRCIAPPPALLHADGAPPGQVAAHLVGVRPAGDGWVLTRLREAAQAAMESGAPQAAADLLGRALGEPPPPAQRVRRPARGGSRGGERRARDGVRAPGGGAAARPTIRGSAPRSRSRSPRRTRRCSGGWTRWMSSSGRWRSSARLTRRSRLGSRASSWSAASTTRAARRGSRRCSSASPPARLREARRRRSRSRGEWRWFSQADRRRRPPPRWRKLSRARRRARRTGTRGPRCCGA